jgi:hypothetical protein
VVLCQSGCGFGSVVKEGIEKLNFMVYFFTSAEFPNSNFILFIFRVSIVTFFYSCLKNSF